MFDSEDAINLYNFKHELPGEYFPPPKETPPSPYPAGKFSGLMFGDYYCVRQVAPELDQRHQHQQRRGPAGLLVPAHLLHVRPDVQREVHDAIPARGEQQRPVHEPRQPQPVRQGRLLEVDVTGTSRSDAGYPAQPDVRLARGLLGPAPHREDPGRPLPDRFLARLRPQRQRPDRGRRPQLRGAVRQRVGHRLGDRQVQDRARRGPLRQEPRDRARGLLQHGKRPDGQDRTTAQGFAGYRSKTFRLGAQYLWQKRESGDAPASTRRSTSGPASRYWEFSPKKGDLFVRVDNVKGDLGACETGLPGADGIDYLLLSPHAPFTTCIVGGEW